MHKKKTEQTKIIQDVVTHEMFRQAIDEQQLVFIVSNFQGQKDEITQPEIVHEKVELQRSKSTKFMEILRKHTNIQDEDSEKVKEPQIITQSNISSESINQMAEFEQKFIVKSHPKPNALDDPKIVKALEKSMLNLELAKNLRPFQTKTGQPIKKSENKCFKACFSKCLKPKCDDLKKK